MLQIKSIKVKDHAADDYKEILVESAAALTSIGDDAGAGSIAYTAGMTQVWQKDFDGTWEVL